MISLYRDVINIRGAKLHEKSDCNQWQKAEECGSWSRRFFDDDPSCRRILSDARTSGRDEIVRIGICSAVSGIPKTVQ